MKASTSSLTDLSRAPVPHALDFVELAGYAWRGNGESARLLRTPSPTIGGRHVLIVQDVVDTGLTLNYLVRMLPFRGPSLRRRYLPRPAIPSLVEDLPFATSASPFPTSSSSATGFDLDERWRGLPDLHSVTE